MTKYPLDINHQRDFPFRKYLIPFILLIVLISGLILTNIFVQHPQKIETKATTNLVDLNLVASSSQIMADQEFIVTILMNTHDYTVSAAELHLEFSENLEAISFVPTDILPVILLPAELTNGTASLVIGSEPTTPKKGDGLRLADLTFRAKNSGPATIEFDQTTQIAAIESHTDVAGDLTPLSFTVISPTPTPSPTPTSTPTPTPTLTPTPTPTPKIGDINDDNRVNIFDYNLLLEQFDRHDYPPADLDDDGDVDIFDYNLLLENFEG